MRLLRRGSVYIPDRPSAATLDRLDHGDALWVHLRDDRRWVQTAPPPILLLDEAADAMLAELEHIAEDVVALYAQRWGIVAPIFGLVGTREQLEQQLGALLFEFCGFLTSGTLVVVLSDCEFRGVFAHEYFHAIQAQLLGRHWYIPVWLSEGTAVWAEKIHLHHDQQPATTLREYLDGWVARSLNDSVSAASRSLEEYERFGDAFEEDGHVGYRLGLVAAIWLVGSPSETALFDFLGAAASPEWPEAFERAFGFTPA